MITISRELSTQKYISAVANIKNLVKDASGEIHHEEKFAKGPFAMREIIYAGLTGNYSFVLLGEYGSEKAKLELRIHGINADNISRGVEGIIDNSLDPSSS